MRLATARGKGRNPGTAARGRCCILCLVLAQDRPTITGFDQDAWSARLGGAYPDVGSAIQQIAILRGTNLSLLRSLSPTDWDRVGLHAERGEESVRHMAKLYAGHDLVHLRQIARIRQATSG